MRRSYSGRASPVQERERQRSGQHRTFSLRQTVRRTDTGRQDKQGAARDGATRREQGVARQEEPSHPCHPEHRTAGGRAPELGQTVLPTHSLLSMTMRTLGLSGGPTVSAGRLDTTCRGFLCGASRLSSQVSCPQWCQEPLPWQARSAAAWR